MAFELLTGNHKNNSLIVVLGPKVTVMLFNKSSILDNQRRPAPTFLILIIVFTYALLSSGCAGTNPLNGYNFTDATIAVEAPVAPPPSIITNADDDFLGVFTGSAESLFRATTAVVKESKMPKARRRIKRAAESIDVSLLVANGILDRSARYLHFAPVEEKEAPDLLLLLNIHQHGIYSGPSFDGRTEFFLNAHVQLLDDYTGESLWEEEINIAEPISDHLLFSNIRSTQDLSKMSEEEMVEALERMSDYTADAIVRRLRSDIHRANR